MATSPRRSRFPMVVIGVIVLAFYLSLSALDAFVVVTLWRLRPDPLTVVVVGITVVVVLGYLSSRFDMIRLLSQLDTRDVLSMESPSVHRLHDRLTERMGLNPPTLKLMRFAASNAMAFDPMGRDVVVLDVSLSRLLNTDEFKVLLARELAHLERKDRLVQSLVASVPQTIVGVGYLFVPSVTFLATDVTLSSAWIRGRSGSWTETLARRVRLRLDELVGLLGFGPTVLVRSQSRKRKFAADARAAEVTDKPMAFTSALQKLGWAARSQHGLSPLWVYDEVEVEDSVSDLFSTHPSTGECVERLATMTDEPMTRIRVH